MGERTATSGHDDPTSGSGESAGPAAAPVPDDDGWALVASLGELPAGTLKSVQVDGQAVALANVDGDVYALEDRCSHQDFPLSDGELEGTKLECIYHGAKFDVCSGRAVQLPAIRPVKTWEVEVRDGDIFLKTG